MWWDAPHVKACQVNDASRAVTVSVYPPKEAKSRRLQNLARRILIFGRSPGRACRIRSAHGDETGPYGEAASRGWAGVRFGRRRQRDEAEATRCKRFSDRQAGRAERKATAGGGEDARDRDLSDWCFGSSRRPLGRGFDGIGGRRRKTGHWEEAVWWRKDLHRWQPNSPNP